MTVEVAINGFGPVEMNAHLSNGPLGALQLPPVDRATVAPAHAAADLTRAGPYTSGTEQLTHVSTAGGAFLEWPKGQTLPGVAALTRADQAA